jgi:hypothetical protein
MQYIEVEVWIAYNEDGEHVVRDDRDDMHEAWTNEVNDDCHYWVRMITVKIPAPQIPAATVTLSDREAEAVEVVEA